MLGTDLLVNRTQHTGAAIFGRQTDRSTVRVYRPDTATARTGVEKPRGGPPMMNDVYFTLTHQLLEEARRTREASERRRRARGW